MNFANGLPRARAAVQNALIRPDSHGPVEDQITKWTLLKRQSYGRAQVDLLRQRMLSAA
jgi:transposase